MAEYISKNDALWIASLTNASKETKERLQNWKAADVQPVKHGQWFQYNRNGEETYIECTNCCVSSRPRHLQMVTRTGEGLPDYCPNCGARMQNEIKPAYTVNNADEALKLIKEEGAKNGNL